ncbi:hypothetical protein FRC12_005038 [Ceratobasidium sp. 428]|nr:hypothetical protein FRC12_005038 [Ceratobasidium sp. 428]
MPPESESTDLKLDPPSEKFVWAIDSLLAENALVSIAVLEEILNLGEAPNNLGLMSEPRIVSVCMRLLRQHCAQSRVFEDNQYGFICIQVISLCVQVDLLRKMDCLKQFVREATTRELQKSALAIVLSQVLFVRSHSNLRAASRTPGAISEPPYSTTVLTPDHAGWLLDRFHRERDLLLRAWTTRAEHWSGWSILLYSLWDKLTDGNKARHVQRV